MRTPEELRAIKQQRLGEGAQRQAPAKIVVGMGTCGIAAGAREVMHAILDELQARGVSAEVTTAGCAGVCAREPLVTVEAPGVERVTYGNVNAGGVARLVEQHLVRGQVVREWLVDL